MRRLSSAVPLWPIPWNGQEQRSLGEDLGLLSSSSALDLASVVSIHT